MEFAETGHRREDRPRIDLPVSLLMALPRLAGGVREVDEIDNFFPLLLLLLFEPRK